MDTEVFHQHPRRIASENLPQQNLAPITLSLWIWCVCVCLCLCMCLWDMFWMEQVSTWIHQPWPGCSKISCFRYVYWGSTSGLRVDPKETVKPSSEVSKTHLSLLAWTLSIYSIFLEAFARWAVGAGGQDPRVSFNDKALSFANFVTLAFLGLIFLTCQISTLLALQKHCEHERRW